MLDAIYHWLWCTSMSEIPNLILACVHSVELKSKKLNIIKIYWKYVLLSIFSPLILQPVDFKFLI